MNQLPPLSASLSSVRNVHYYRQQINTRSNLGYTGNQNVKRELINSQRAPFVLVRYPASWMRKAWRAGSRGHDTDPWLDLCEIGRITMRWKTLVIERISRGFDPPDSHGKKRALVHRRPSRSRFLPRIRGIIPPSSWTSAFHGHLSWIGLV